MAHARTTGTSAKLWCRTAIARVYMLGRVTLADTHGSRVSTEATFGQGALSAFPLAYQNTNEGTQLCVAHRKRRAMSSDRLSGVKPPLLAYLATSRQTRVQRQLNKQTINTPIIIAYY